MLSIGIELCFRNGHSNEQYRQKLPQLGATAVPKDKRKLSIPPNSKEEWSLAVNGTTYLTSFHWANTFCGIFGPGGKEEVVAAVIGPSLKFKYYGLGASADEIYRGQFDGEPATIMVSSVSRGEVFLVFALDKMWDVFPGGPQNR
ncbi:hypothetical protein BJA01nite_49500 [Bradyrhizobium japonicum]|nr:hypothetical protein CF64_34170 [Bradyrhizobium japonicum]BAL13481.1 hypothetical protein BJ6T_82370 [Bradyrhizobium japonicum USDA 6]GEC47308.1 hypothetical protein BJA01nite_49500 [Bradyrhizobium japonicum]